MNAVFADTAFYVALNNEHDALHPLSLTWLSSSSEKIITTEFVLLEASNFFRQPTHREVFLTCLELTRSDPDTTIVPLSSNLMQRGLDLFTARPDKEWSLTDCTSFVVMEELGLTDALTADHHFERAGFRALLKE